jgi:hypothetical protein
MESIYIDNYEFLRIDLCGAEAIFSTAKGDLDFNKEKRSGLKNLDNLKRHFNIQDVGYLSQVHGDKVVDYSRKLEKADGLLTTKKGIGVGVFNADCVPILLYDSENDVVCAVHSGWKGTLNLILMKAVQKMKSEYKSSADNIYACIGPHINVCCYEVGDEVVEKFAESQFYKDRKDIFLGNNLDLRKCLLHELHHEGIDDDNIICVDVCTSCNKMYRMHSYRKNKDCGRMFSFIYMK